MSNRRLRDIDVIAVSLGRAVAMANRHALEMGYLPEEHRLAVEQEDSPTGIIWRVSYIPNVGVNLRGGGCIIDVNAANGNTQDEFHCQ